MMAQHLVPEAWVDAADWAGSQKRSIYHLFFALGPLVSKAHRATNDEFLVRAFGFAEWCARHRAKHLWNAAGVAFYEHLLDDGLPPASMAPWISPEVHERVCGLMEWQAGAEKALELRQNIRTGLDQPWRRAIGVYLKAEGDLRS